MPKVVLIMTDTQSTDIVGCYNQDKADFALKTPNIDRLASQGLRFDRAYCCQPVCGPARAALFTGTYPHTNASWANSMPLDANTKTIGQRLTDHGVHAAYVGKWHLDGGDYFGWGQCPDGWDPTYWYDMKCYLDELSEEDRVRSRQFATCLEEGFGETFTYGNRCSNRAIDFLNNHAEEDFLLVVSYDEPHGPFLCPAPYNTMYNEYRHPLKRNAECEPQGKPEHVQRWAKGQKSQTAKAREQGYINNPGWFGCNSYVDHEIGRVLDAVDQFAPDALVIYTADHGNSLCSHGVSGKGPAMYDEIAKVPCIVRWPGVTSESSVCREPVSHIDVVPTILDHFSLAEVDLLEGRSLRQVCEDPTEADGEPVFIEFNRFEIDHDGMLGFMPVRCVFDGRYKLILNLLSSDELYDLESDPDEMENVIDDDAVVDVRDRLHERLLDWMNDTRDPFRGYVWEQRPWRTTPVSKGGMTRQRPDDGYLPGVLDYDNGLPVKGLCRAKFGV